jgi:hypothetical protein
VRSKSASRRLEAERLASERAAAEEQRRIARKQTEDEARAAEERAAQKAAQEKEEREAAGRAEAERRREEQAALARSRKEAEAQKEAIIQELWEKHASDWVYVDGRFVAVVPNLKPIQIASLKVVQVIDSNAMIVTKMAGPPEYEANSLTVWLEGHDTAGKIGGVSYAFNPELQAVVVTTKTHKTALGQRTVALMVPMKVIRRGLTIEQFHTLIRLVQEGRKAGPDGIRWP